MEFPLPFVELQEDLVVDDVVGEQLLLGQAALVGQGRRVDLPVLGWVLQLHFKYPIYHALSFRAGDERHPQTHIGGPR